VRAIYASRSAEEQDALSLDADGVLSDDDGGCGVPLGERIPDRSIDVLSIVLLRERVAEAALELRRLRAERGEQYMNGPPAEATSMHSRPLHLLPGMDITDAAKTVGREKLEKAA
jgi:hypothetical protein